MKTFLLCWLGSSDRGCTGGIVLTLRFVINAHCTLERTRKRRRKIAAAPLVDSTLLRFISEQKRRQEPGQLGNGEDRTDISTLVASESLLTDSSASRTASWSDDAMSEDLFERLQQQQQPPAVDQLQQTTVAAGTAESDENIRSAQWDLWLCQYNRNRLAQELIALDVDVESATATGKIIQSYVLTRTARRRIRIFLRDRDSLWNASDEERAAIEQQSRLDSKRSKAGAIPPKYGFGDVVGVMLEYGLTGKDICTILSHSPSVAMMMPRKSFMELPELQNISGDDTESTSLTNENETLEDTLQRAFVDLLQGDLELRRYDARKIVRSCPGLLTVRGSQAAVQNVVMMTKLGVSKNSLARDKTSLPTLLSRSPAAVFRLVSFFSCDKVRMPIKSIGPLLRRPVSKELLNLVAPVPKLQELSDSPQIDNVESLGPYEESAAWGRFREQRAQNINAVYRKMSATAEALRFEVGTKDLGKLISAYPSALLLDAEQQILPAASFLVSELGIWEDGLAGILQEYPLLLGKDVEEMKRVTTLLKYWGVEEDDLGSMFRAFPALLTMDIETQMIPVVNFLIKIGVSNIGAFITRFPPVLGYSVENELQPKWDYLVRVCLRPTFEINNFPAYFSYPFERVIQARYDYLETRGIARQLVPVDAVVRFGDVDFATKIARDGDGGKLFRAFTDKRNIGMQSNRSNKRPPRPTKVKRSD